MELVGKNLIGGEWSAEGATTFHAVNPSDGSDPGAVFTEATASEVDRAMWAAEHAFREYAHTSPAQRAAFLRAIAEELIALGPVLLERASAETALPMPRLEGERGRTVGQLRLFADYLEEGSWVAARVDRPDPERKPLAKPDVRRMLVPLGPVAIFGASNFPMAFSVPGGDTASALAAGCTIVCKAHPAHPGTSELCARAILAAAEKTGMPRGVFSIVHGWSHEVGMALVRHPLATAVGFTGSLRGGRAIADAAAARPTPIPVYAEMGSINPVFLLPSAATERAEAIVAGLATSITTGVGQFCTNPGVIVGLKGDSLSAISSALTAKLNAAAPGTMLYQQLAAGYNRNIEQTLGHGASRSTDVRAADGASAVPTLLQVEASRFASEAGLREEMFGPVSIVVTASDKKELEDVAASLEGQLTATIHGTPEELVEHARLVHILQRKVGRLLFNGYPTGVEVGHAMHHGGPYPASSDSRTTSVGSDAIVRFARPICLQNFPDDALPPALRNRNELGIMRLIDGNFTREDV